MSKIKNGWLDQYGTGPFEQRQFGTAGVEGVNRVQQLQMRMMLSYGEGTTVLGSVRVVGTSNCR